MTNETKVRYRQLPPTRDDTEARLMEMARGLRPQIVNRMLHLGITHKQLSRAMGIAEDYMGHALASEGGFYAWILDTDFSMDMLVKMTFALRMKVEFNLVPEEK